LPSLNDKNEDLTRVHLSRPSKSTTHSKTVSHIHSHQDEIGCASKQFDALNHVEISIKNTYGCPMIKQYGAWNKH